MDNSGGEEEEESTPAKVAQLEYPGLRIEKEVLRFNVSVTNTISMDVG